MKWQSRQGWRFVAAPIGTTCHRFYDGEPPSHQVPFITRLVMPDSGRAYRPATQIPGRGAELQGSYREHLQSTRHYQRFSRNGLQPTLSASPVSFCT